MNKPRRKQIAEIITRVNELKELMDSLKSDIEEVAADEQDYYDNMIEAFQDGEKGDRAQEVVEYLEEAAGMFDDIDLDSLVNSLEEAAQ